MRRKGAWVWAVLLRAIVAGGWASQFFVFKMPR
jgi:hypothetical protein